MYYMSYCTLSEAWGRENFTSIIPKKETRVANRYELYKELQAEFAEEDRKKVCSMVQSHIESCPDCKAKYMSNEKCLLPVIDLNNLSKYVKENHDTVTIVLIVLIIVLVLKLLN